jgi:hypothetical protein
MKKVILLSLILIASLHNGFSQDIITKKNAEDIKAKVLEVTTTDVSFKKFDSPNGPTYRILKSEILMIRYQDGTKDVFTEAQAPVEKPTSDNLEAKGRQDANANYKGANSGAGWTAATTIVFSPLLGAIPAAVCASSEPIHSNLKVKNLELMKINSYNQAYTEQAHKIKKNKIWKSFGISSGVWLAVIIVLGL